MSDPLEDWAYRRPGTISGELSRQNDEFWRERERQRMQPAPRPGYVRQAPPRKPKKPRELLASEIWLRKFIDRVDARIEALMRKVPWWGWIAAGAVIALPMLILLLVRQRPPAIIVGFTAFGWFLPFGLAWAVRIIVALTLLATGYVIIGLVCVLIFVTALGVLGGLLLLIGWIISLF